MKRPEIIHLDGCHSSSCNCAEVMPQPVDETKEIVICAAIKMPDGYVIRGHRHADCIATYNRILKYKGIKTGGDEHGFVTSLNRYVTRLEGCRIQKAAGIKSRLDMVGGQAYLYGDLYSEDLY
ncbi:MAG: hypothetical protein Q7K40_03700 [bacterium]|nr:hypothetical protein [bacterium]